jgi:hypothetical protein
VSEQAARRPATLFFLTEAERSEASLLGVRRALGDFSTLVRGVSEALPPESHFPPLNPPIGSITASASTFTAYLSLSTDRLSSDHCLERSDHRLPSRSAQSC